jgi:hypothetical protein
MESLLNVEKQMRLAGDVVGMWKAVIYIVELCYKAGAWKTLNDSRLSENSPSLLSRLLSFVLCYMSIRAFRCGLAISLLLQGLLIRC